MKKNVMKVFTLILTVLLAFCLCSCTNKTEKTSIDENKQTASENNNEEKAPEEVTEEDVFVNVLKELVDEYGFPTVGETTYNGVLDFEIIDLNDDGEEELFVICSKGENGFFSAIYSNENGDAVKAWETDYMGAFDSAFVKKQNEKTCIFLTTTYRYWTDGIITYNDGKFVNLYDGEGYNEEEQKKYDEAASYGIGEGDNAEINIYLNRIGLTLDEPWEEVTKLSTGMDIAASTTDMKINLRKMATECKKNLEAHGIVHTESVESILSKIPYYGDVKKCKMDEDMAQAYAEAIASMEPFYTSDPGESWSREYELCALLADPAGDGIPILITVYLDKYNSFYDTDCDENYGDIHEMQMWQYKDGKVTDAKVQKLDYDNGFGEIDGKTYYRSIEFSHEAGCKRTANYYLIENGTITLNHTVEIYDAYEISDEEVFFYGELPEGKTYGRTQDEFSANGWVEVETDGFSNWYFIVLDGKDVTSEYVGKKHDEVVGYSYSDEIAHINDGENHITLYNESAWNVAELLSACREN